MMKIFWVMWIACIVLMAVPVSAEYYQYTDENGNLRFSDTPPEISDDRTADILSFESVMSADSAISFSEEDHVSNEILTDPSSEFSESDTDTFDGQLQLSVKELEQMKKEIDRKYDKIMAERKAIEAGAPGKNAKSGELGDYNYRIRELNKKIEDYDQVVDDYEKKSDLYNARIKKNK